MSKEYKINQKDYYNKEDIEIVITKKIITPEITKQETVTFGTLLFKLEKVKAEKKLIMSRYDNEINEIQGMLEDLKIDDVEIKLFVPIDPKKVIPITE